jgi:hypothetical protein
VFGIDSDKIDLNLVALVTELMENDGHVREIDWTYIRAVGKAEQNNTHVAFEVLAGASVAVLVDEGGERIAITPTRDVGSAKL